MKLHKKKPIQQPVKIYDSKVTVDTIKLKFKASKQQIDSIFDHINYGYYSSNDYEYNFHMKDIGFSMHINPLPVEKRSNFTVAITLQTAFFKADYLPHSIVDILTSYNFRIRGLDIAFDYAEPYAHSFVYKHHGLVKHYKLTDDNNHTSINLGSPTVEQRNHRVISYSRNEKEYSKGISESNRHSFSNRFEVKLRFPMKNSKDTSKELRLNDINQNAILKQLKRHIFIPNLENDLQLDGRTKRIFYGLQQDYSNINRYDTKRKAELKAIAYSFRQPIEEVYTSHITDLFSFLTYREHQGTMSTTMETEQYHAMLDEQHQLLRL